MADNLITSMLSSIESELRSQISRLNESSTEQFYEIMTYHMGWTGENVGEFSRGKRIRPLLLLLSAASGKKEIEWQNSLPGAAAIELVHNFSLIHDDIEDGSKKRRNRPTAWNIWGVPQAINAGDGLFALANLAVTDLSAHYKSEIVLKISQILHRTCLNLTRGQYMDMFFENSEKVTLEDYWLMITYKTASLISAATEIGSILAGFNEETQDAFRQFGHYLGLAFQIKDDILGIWGDEDKTGKSTSNDLVSHKKTLPVLFCLQKDGPFAERWNQGNIKPEEIPVITEQISKEGGFLYCQETADLMSDMANKYLSIISPQGIVGEALYTIFNILLKREA